MEMKYSPIAKGVVECYDEHNNLLFTRENMIVKTGRAYILRSLFEDIYITSLNAYFSENSNVSTPDMTYNGLTSGRVGTGSTVRIVKVDTDELYAQLEIEKPAGSTGKNISSLELCFSDEGETTLFSRVVFPPYPDSANLKFTYKIYF